MTFFTLSLTVLLISHLIYSVVFVFHYAKPDLKFSRKILLMEIAGVPATIGLTTETTKFTNFYDQVLMIFFIFI